MKFGSTKRLKRGKITVKGSDEIIIETPFRPRVVKADFAETSEESSFPSCEMPEPDWVEATPFVKLDGEDKFGIKIRWKTRTTREVSWSAKK